MLVIVIEQPSDVGTVMSSTEPLALNSLVPSAKVPAKALARVVTGQPTAAPGQAAVLHTISPKPKSCWGMHEVTPSIADCCRARKPDSVTAFDQHASKPLWSTRSAARAGAGAATASRSAFMNPAVAPDLSVQRFPTVMII